MKLWRIILIITLLTTSLISTYAQAGVVIGGTRLIYDGGKKEASLNISNPDKTPFLIQSWVDTSEGRDAKNKAPFIITPPLFRLEGNQDNVLRIVRAGGNLPTDKESLFWLNIKAIPPAEATENSLQIAIKTRIKLIYRPAKLPGSLDEAAAELKWQRNGNMLQVTNSSPYYITFSKIKINEREIAQATMVAPGSNISLPLPAGVQNGTLSWQIINDYGGASKALTRTL